MSYKILRPIAIVVLFFFSWTFLGVYNLAYAIDKQISQSALNQPKEQKPEERFEKSIKDVEDTINNLKKVKTHEELINEKDILRAKRSKIEGHDAEIRSQFAETENKIKSLPDEIKQRHKDFVKKYEENLNILRRNLDDIEKAETAEEVKVEVEKTKTFLEKTKPPSKHTPLDPNKLPHRTPEIKKKEPRLKYSSQYPVDSSYEFGVGSKEKADNSSPITHHASPILVASIGDLQGIITNAATQALPPPTQADLSETIEIQFTQQIKDLATQLQNNPVKIYEWVRNNIEFVPTYGSIQGADMCLQTRQCNAFDTASLLIALLRTSNIPAKYVYGTIEIPIDKVMNWVGGFTDANSALDFIASGGIPVSGIISGGKISAARVEHVWVEAYIPYGNYRGTMRDNSNKTWIPMDGSYKQYTYTSGMDITSTISFTTDEYLSQVQTQNPVHYYQDKIQSYLDANMPDKTIIDIKGYRDIKEQNLGILPSTLPYKSIAILNRYSMMPGNLRATVSFTLFDPYLFSQVSYSISTIELAGKRITLSYIPASSSDEALISSYNGYMYDVPAYLLNLKPVLKIEGITRLSGYPTTMGSDQTLTIQFSAPDGTFETAQKKLIAGTYYGIAINIQGVNENILGKRNYNLTTNLTTQTAATLTNDDLIGEHLHILATTYFMANDKIFTSGAKIYNIANTRILSEGIASFTLSVSYVFSIPKTVTPSGIEMDVGMERIIAISKEGSISKEKQYIELSGMAGSYHEHDIFEKINGFSSVSAVKALQTASTQGIPIYKITNTNIGSILPLLQLSSEITNNIQNAVNAGKEVIVSQSNVKIDDWVGAGYIIRNPQTGAGAYMISGGLAGGSSTKNADGWQIVALFKGAFAGLKDMLDVVVRRYIATAAQLEVGERIAVAAKEMAKVKAGYEDVGRCSGLVRRAYWAAGICLDQWSNCGQNDLGRKNNITWDDTMGGVKYLYDLANKLNINKSVRMTNDPFVGDMVFFDNTTGPGNPLSHMGVVVTGPNSNGMVTFVHATRTAGANTSNMNILKPSDDKENDYIGNFCPKGAGTPCLAGNLFSGYGTVRDPNALK